MGINLHVAWREKATRRGFSLIDSNGERAITVIGERLAPNYKDNLDWSILKKMDGIFITASDSEIFTMARSAPILCATPRVGLNIINNSNVLLDGLIGSNLDPGEVFSLSALTTPTTFSSKRHFVLHIVHPINFLCKYALFFYWFDCVCLIFQL